jgi:hypothetical protein
LENVTYTRIKKLLPKNASEADFAKLFNTIGTDRQIELSEQIFNAHKKGVEESSKKGVPFEQYVIGVIVRLEVAFELQRELGDAQGRFQDEFMAEEFEQTKNV